MTHIDERDTAHKANKRTARTAICPTCGDRFARGKYSNQHKRSRGEIVPTSKYCSRLPASRLSNATGHPQQHPGERSPTSAR